MAKAKYPTPRSVRLDPALDTRLEKIRVAEDRSVSWLIKKAVEEYVDKWEARKKKK